MAGEQDDERVFEAYGEVEVPLPDGRGVFRAPPLQVQEAVKFLRLLRRAQTTGDESVMEFIDSFPSAFEGRPRKQLEGMPPFVLFQVATAFLYHGGTTTPATTPTNPEPEK